MKVLVVGSGMSGSTAARLLHDAGHEVLVLESRPHIGGNCADELRDGVRLHTYGPHLFHTSDARVWSFLGRFTEWTSYRHRVVADTRLGRIPIPWNRRSEALVGRALTDDEIRDLIFVDYSRKQWGVPWEQMPAAITGRVPTRRDNDDDRYFTDTFQGQPKDGYAALFERLLSGIPVETGTPAEAWRDRAERADLVIYTGKLDDCFHRVHGPLPYRSLRFEHTRARARLPHAVINQCNRLPFTRVYDHRWFSEDPDKGPAPGTEPGTIITREYPETHDESNLPFYPMPFGDGMERSAAYRKLAAAQTRMVFLGRLATYAYLDMWMAVAQTFVKLRALGIPVPTDARTPHAE